MYICVSKLTIIVPDNASSPGWRQAIIWTNAAILLISTIETKFTQTLHLFNHMIFQNDIGEHGGDLQKLQFF